jgi:adenine-specific DNA-methyltransferase
MPTLDFKGKQFVYAHHLSVPFKQLDIDEKKSLPKDGKPSLDDNLIIQGDNLHALKALLPKYAGKVNCIYIDPPYNTGNEGWCYNDNVNAPIMKEWLKKEGNPVDKEDLERHDKWLCMMWPRLQLLHELLADDGLIFISIDSNEIHNLRLIMDEIYGNDNFIADIVWEKRYGRSNDAKLMASLTDHILMYRKSDYVDILREPRNEQTNSGYSNVDNDPRGDWTSVSFVSQRTKAQRANLAYKIKNPFTNEIIEHPTNSWKYNEEKYKEMLADNRFYWGKDGKYQWPRIKRFLSELPKGLVPIDLWKGKDTGTGDEGTKEVNLILGKDKFNYPKPTNLIKRILSIQSKNNKNAIILDSCAGSGTTAHAVLALNKEDGGNRKFILVEMEDYANDTTAERVRRVIKGVPNAKDEALKEGLGGSFTFCELGQEINIENLLKGKKLPSYDELTRYAFYTATGLTLDNVEQGADYYIGETENYRVHLVYKPDIVFLRSGDSALNMPLAQSISNARKDTGKSALVFATHKFMGQKELTEMGITYCQLPYAIHRVMGD